jgi:hypothetical protein
MMEEKAKIWHYLIAFLAIIGIQVLLSRYTGQPFSVQDTGTEAGATLLISA